MFTPNEWVDVDDILPPLYAQRGQPTYTHQPSTLETPAPLFSGAGKSALAASPFAYSRGGASFSGAPYAASWDDLQKKVQDQASQIQLLWFIVILCVCIIVNLRGMVSTLQGLLLSRNYGMQGLNAVTGLASTLSGYNMGAPGVV